MKPPQAPPPDSEPTTNEPWVTPPWAQGVLGSTTGQGVRIAVIDSGCDDTLNGTPFMTPGHGLVDPDDELRLAWSDDTHDRIGHGTACCRIIHRMAPGATLVPLRVFGRRLETSPEMILGALTWAMENDCQAVNLSLGTQSQRAIRPFYRLCQRAHDRGIVILSALPLGGEVSYPAVFDPVLGVTLGDGLSPFHIDVDPDDAAEVQAYGRHYGALYGDSRWLTGSSFAAPHVTGLVARLLEQQPDLGLAGVRRRLTDLAAAKPTDQPSQSS